jgi:hypothetical protein
MGCDDPTNGAKELECMRKVPANDLVNFMGQYVDELPCLILRRDFYWPLPSSVVIKTTAF